MIYMNCYKVSSYRNSQEVSISPRQKVFLYTVLPSLSLSLFQQLLLLTMLTVLSVVCLSVCQPWSLSFSFSFSFSISTEKNCNTY